MSRPAVVAATSAQPTARRPSLLRAARVFWLLFVLLAMVLCYASMPVYLRYLSQPCAGATCQLDGAVTASDLQTLHAVGISPQQYVIATAVLFNLAILIWLAVGVLIFLRRRDDLGILVIALVLATGNPTAANGPITALVIGNPAWATPVSVLNFLSSLSFDALFLFFPDGRFVPRWTRWLALVAVIEGIVTTFLPTSFPFNDPDGPGPALQAVFFLGFAATLLFAQIYRYRRAASERARAQTKWAVFGLVTALIGVLLLNVAIGVSSTLGVTLLSEPVLNMLFPLVLLCIPVSIGIAILRSRLYDIDVIIRRTLIYGSLTAILAGVYIGGVVGVQSIVNSIAPHPGNEASPILIVITTLVIAALFQPLRRMIQRFIDRRFYRSKYDSRRTLESFSAALRQEVDLAALTGQLVAVVTETMEPAHISLWLRDGENAGHAAR
jgi:hypothetical protein